MGKYEIYTETCDKCGGDGKILTQKNGKLIQVKCPTCNGTRVQELHTCKACKGVKYTIVGSEVCPCRKCNGTGFK